MNPQLIAILVNNILVPEIVGIIRRHHASTGEVPTEEEIKAQMNVKADALIAQADAWLAAHPDEQQ